MVRTVLTPGCTNKDEIPFPVNICLTTRYKDSYIIAMKFNMLRNNIA